MVLPRNIEWQCCGQSLTCRYVMIPDRIQKKLCAKDNGATKEPSIAMLWSESHMQICHDS
eukprot:1005623-Amphidinium_carterae.1